MASPRLPLRSLVTVLLSACQPGLGPLEQVRIPRGADFPDVVDSLRAHGLVGSPAVFTALARVTGTDRQVQAGLYQFRRGTSASAILRALREGAVVQVRFTVPEGLTLMDIAALAESVLAIPRDSVLAAGRDTAWLRSLGVEGPSADGFLLPETYLFSGSPTARDLVGEMIEQFQARWDPAWDSALAASGRSRLALLALASIVEGEARSDEERPIIAGVYANRLRIGMALQADPTVQYAIQLATGERKPRLYEKDYLVPSPYNTYLHPGLPPGPVGAPGRRSIEAALAPPRVPYLYFVAGPDGRHRFSRTYEEHLRTVARLRRAN
jgi:UPF0755 protein